MFENFSRRRCFVSIISASRHRISDGKTATRFALFVDLSLSLLFPARPSSSPFFTFSFAVRFRRHGDTRKSRFTVACHKGCFVAKAARGRQGEGGRESMRMKDERGGPLGEKERTELGMKIAGQTLDFRCTRTIRYCTLQHAASPRARIILVAARKPKNRVHFFFYLIFACKA